MSGLPPTGMLDGSLGLSTDGILVLAAPVVISGVSPSAIPDDGGLLMSAEGPWPTDQAVLVWVDVGDGGPLRNCYSGVVGQGFRCLGSGSTLEWVSPPLPIGGPYTVVFESEDGLFSGTAQGLTVVHRSFATRLYSLRASTAWPRAVGAYDISEES